MRIGSGYDVHRLEDNRKLIIGGVEIEYEKGLLGHSDADVLVHAVMDALLGAAGLCDIGTHFSDDDEKYSGISSILLLKKVKELINKNDYHICNIDATIIAQAPKMKPYIDEMRNNIATALEIDFDQINIKATTEEGLGFTGRGEGIAAQAVALIDKKTERCILKIYNTLTAKKEDFIPIEDGNVKMYVCGPTVYNLIHIGNARPMIVFDAIRRYLEYKGFDVTYVSNFTDVDDKIINAANEEGVDPSVISERYIAECLKDMKAMNVRPADIIPKATEEIDGMIEMIQILIDKGYAYESKGTVYFRTREFNDYGKLSKKNVDDLQAGHRSIKVTGEDEKEDPLDFVLWKPKKEGEPSWKSPWSDGRPGWHIECSVMAKKYLGEQIDIHAGGEDLIFPHHENEIAQSEAANGKEFAKYWMHNGFLNIDGTKMSKSLGNFFTVRDISEKYDLQVLRFFMLNAHYRSPLNFSDELMASAKSGLERIINTYENLNYIEAHAESRSFDFNDDEDKNFGDEYIEKFEAAMEDDFNTADAIAAIFEFVKAININIKETSSTALATLAEEKLVTMCDVLGIILDNPKKALDVEIEQMIEKRQTARKEKDFAQADKIRDKLLEMGIVLEDTREGVKWHRK